jgi:hypothetical protein
MSLVIASAIKTKARKNWKFLAVITVGLAFIWLRDCVFDDSDSGAKGTSEAYGQDHN